MACTIKSNHEIAGVSPNLNTAAAPRKRYTRTNTAEHFIHIVDDARARESITHSVYARAAGAVLVPRRVPRLLYGLLMYWKNNWPLGADFVIP